MGKLSTPVAGISHVGEAEYRVNKCLPGYPQRRVHPQPPAAGRFGRRFLTASVGTVGT
ncbi:hypothetical protein [Mycolicibacterium porcinum]|uniref:Uncharacterized protein n=1 Tax=Mycolicibacterium porcinum TaxID=39693 RepID=A0AAW5TEB8_9MYCO|nr:hypothetical protein [Mycolicibacterium porcinum]MBX8687514.1 hypothetical protein [Mycobacterium sp. 20091114027_K0903767]MCV7392892.1 hypothetical protein [Mycolicibacterium porcinum]